MYERPAKPQRLWDPDSALQSPQGLEFIVLVQLPLDIAYLVNRPAPKLPIVAFPHIPACPAAAVSHVDRSPDTAGENRRHANVVSSPEVLGRSFPYLAGIGVACRRLNGSTPHHLNGKAQNRCCHAAVLWNKSLWPGYEDCEKPGRSANVRAGCRMCSKSCKQNKPLKDAVYDVRN